MPAGRPPKYKTESWFDCKKISKNDYDDIFTYDFKTESELCDYLENNISDVCNDLFEEKYFMHVREFNLDQQYLFGPRQKRIDFFITTTTGNILCEVKNPTNLYSELTNSISQMMSYIVTSKKNEIRFHRSIIITSRYHDQFREIINEFNLPIELFCVSKSKLLKLI